MRQYAWYSPELDVIALQTIIEDREVVFEFDCNDAVSLLTNLYGEDPMQQTLWFPLGEV